MPTSMNNALQTNELNVSNESHKVLEFIDSTFSRVLSEIEKRPVGNPQIVLQRVKSLNVNYDIHEQKLVWEICGRQVCYGWPGNTSEEARRFAIVGRVLLEIHTAITSGLRITKRDIFYHDPILFGRQEVVDRYIDDIAYTCKVTRRDLNVAASPRGLYFSLWDDDRLPHTISDNVIDTAGLSQLRWILVVEKEATFKVLMESGKQNLPGIVLTGRGYPDLATRRFLRRLADYAGSDSRVYGLFDADPDGIAILRCYQVGSKVIVQEQLCCVPNMLWIGIRFGDIDDDESMPLTQRDRNKAKALLSNLNSGSCGLDEALHCQALQEMLMLSKKAEIQAISTYTSGLLEWLVERIGASFLGQA